MYDMSCSAASLLAARPLHHHDGSRSLPVSRVATLRSLQHQTSPDGSPPRIAQNPSQTSRRERPRRLTQRRVPSAVTKTQKALHRFPSSPLTAGKRAVSVGTAAANPGVSSGTHAGRTWGFFVRVFELPWAWCRPRRPRQYRQTR